MYKGRDLLDKCMRVDTYEKLLTLIIRGHGILCCVHLLSH